MQFKSNHCILLFRDLYFGLGKLKKNSVSKPNGAHTFISLWWWRKWWMKRPPLGSFHSEALFKLLKIYSGEGLDWWLSGRLLWHICNIEKIWGLYLNEVDYLDPFQSVFRPGHGTKAELIGQIDDLGWNLEEGCMHLCSYRSLSSVQ